jgi:hypothetical protein
LGGPLLHNAHIKIDNKLTKKVLLFGDTTHSVTIGSHLSTKQEKEFVVFLRENANIFAWDPCGLPGIPRDVIEHKVSADPAARPIKQKVRRQAHDQEDFIIDEVLKLEVVRVVCWILHPTWMVNPVMLPKTNLKKWMCVDFTDLNHARPRTHFLCLA